MATVVEPTSVQRRSKRRDFPPDPSDDDAETLVFDLPEREADEWLIDIAEGATQPPIRPRTSAFRASRAQIAMTMFAALIGAMAAAWSVEQRALASVGSPEALVASLREVWYAVTGPQVAAAERPQPSEPERVAPALAPTAAAAASPAPEAEPVTGEPPLVHKPRQRAAARSSPAGFGTLRINSRPWSVVHVDGRRIGSTPQTAIELPAGRHRVVLVSDEFDLKRTLTVKVRAGKTVTRSVELIQ